MSITFLLGTFLLAGLYCCTGRLPSCWLHQNAGLGRSGYVALSYECRDRPGKGRADSSETKLSSHYVQKRLMLRLGCSRAAIIRKLGENKLGREPVVSHVKHILYHDQKQTEARHNPTYSRRPLKLLRRSSKQSLQQKQQPLRQ